MTDELENEPDWSAHRSGEGSIVEMGAAICQGLSPEEIPPDTRLDACFSNSRLRRMVMVCDGLTGDYTGLRTKMRQLCQQYPRYYQRLRSYFSLDCKPGWLERELSGDNEIVERRITAWNRDRPTPTASDSTGP